MKKFISTISIVIGLPITYFLITAIMSPMFLIGYCITHKLNITKINASEIIMSNLYIVTTLAGILTILLLILFFLPTKESLIKRCNFKPVAFNKIIYIIIFTIGFAFLTSMFVDKVSKFFKSYEVIQQSLVNTHISIIQILCVTILIPIIEEIFFRGVIFGFLKKNFNIVIAVIVQALIFAIMHGNILQGIYTFILGIVLALINIYSNSLYGNIVCHITFNIFGTLIIPYLATKNPYMIIFILIGLIMISFGIIKIINSTTKFKIS